jgi:uncharacterized protein DUF2752
MTLGQLPASRPRAATRTRRLAAPLLSAGVVGGLTVALHYRDPHVRGSWGFCPFKALTGLDCPGCGGLRAVNDLTRLDLAGAASSNLLLVLAIPFVVVLWALWFRRRWRGTGPLPIRVPGAPLRWGQVALAVLALWTVVRNLPLAGWLAA